MIAESRLGRWSTKQIFNFIADDFIKSNYQQDLSQTILRHSFAQSLSGALHVEPLGYLDCVRDGRIKIVEGGITGPDGKTVEIKANGEESIVVEADSELTATDYTLVSQISFRTCNPGLQVDCAREGSTILCRQYASSFRPYQAWRCRFKLGRSSLSQTIPSHCPSWIDAHRFRDRQRRTFSKYRFQRVRIFVAQSNRRACHGQLGLRLLLRCD